MKEAKGSFQCPSYVFSLPPNLSWRAENVGFEALVEDISSTPEHDLVPIQFLPVKENRMDPILEAVARIKLLEHKLSRVAAYAPDSAYVVHNATLLHVKRMGEHMLTLESIVAIFKYSIIILTIILSIKPLSLAIGFRSRWFNGKTKSGNPGTVGQDVFLPPINNSN